MSGTGDAPLPGDAGTTLIEALTVVAILTMVALVGFPNVQQGLLSIAQRQTAAGVASALRRAQAEALRRETPVAFAITTDGLAYGAAGEPLARVPPGVTLAPAGSVTVFYSDGSSQGGRIAVAANRRAIPVTVLARSGVVLMGGG